MKFKELKEKRKGLLNEAKAITDKAGNENRQLTQEESQRFETIVAEVEKMMPDFERSQFLHEERNFLHGQMSEVNTPTYWRAADGKEFRVYKPAERFYEGSVEPEVRFGEIARAMILGPKTDAEKRALAEGTGSAGGYTVSTVLGAQMIDLMREKTHVIKAGAQTINLESSNYSLAKVLTGATATWRAENTDVTTSEPTFGKVDWAPKSLAVIVPVSRELLADSINITTALENEFARCMATELENVCLQGTGTSNQPKGVLNYTDTQVIDMGANGAAITNYSQIVSAYQKLFEANANAPTAAIMAPRTWATYANFTATDGQPLMMPKQIETLPFYESTIIPTNLTKGTANNASNIFIADWTQLVIGLRQDMVIELLRERYADKLQAAFLVSMRVDVAAIHEKSFVVVKGVKP